MSNLKVNSSNWFMRHKIITGLLGLIILGIIISAGSSGSTKPTSNTSTDSSNQPASSNTTTQSSSNSTPAQRQTKGVAVTLGAGTFTGGKDVADGLYDVTTSAGDSGNFMVSGNDSYNEILGVADGQGVPKIRVQVSNGDQIQISGLSNVTFTPVTAPYVTAHTATSLYAGTFNVGQDIGAGRYIVTPESGQSGNFMVDGTDSYNEILGGDSSTGGVPSLTVNLTKGDTITISSLEQVNFQPTN